MSIDGKHENKKVKSDTRFLSLFEVKTSDKKKIKTRFDRQF